MKLWQKNNQTMDSFIETFETKGDLVLDQKLTKYDVYGSLAQIKMLKKIGIVTEKEESTAITGLLEVLELHKKGNFTLEHGDEDIHTKIENFLTEKYGEVGKKIHTGRSRNDQVLTDLRLYTKENMLSIWEELLELIHSFYAFSKQYEFVPMPGYTHMQKAMPSSVGMWGGSFTESLLDSLVQLKTAYELNDKSPLGSAAGYGAPLQLDREYTAKLLGFGSVQINSLYCQNSRGKIESLVLAALCTILQDINKFATDVLLFTTAEFNYFSVSNDLCSGSSIMPQKVNLDLAELLRSKVHSVLGNYMQLIGMTSNLPSGYNRDFQDTKKPLIESLEMTLDCIRVANMLINKLSPQEDKMKQALTPEIYATHNVLQLVGQGIPFRKAYQTIKEKINETNTHNPEKTIKESQHLGGTGNLFLKHYFVLLKQEKEIYNKEMKKFTAAIISLLTDTQNETQKLAIHY